MLMFDSALETPFPSRLESVEMNNEVHAGQMGPTAIAVSCDIAIRGLSKPIA